MAQLMRTMIAMMTDTHAGSLHKKDNPFGLDHILGLVLICINY